MNRNEKPKSNPPKAFKIGARVSIHTREIEHNRWNGMRGRITELFGKSNLFDVWVLLDNGSYVPFSYRELRLVENPAPQGQEGGL